MVTTSSGKTLRGDFTNTANQRSMRPIKNSDQWLERALLGYEKVLTHRGRVMYKIDQDLVGLGFQGPDAYLRDENGKPVPETVHKEDTKAQLHVLKRHRPDTWGKRPKRDAPREGGVLVIGDVTKKPKYNTAKSVQARKLEGGFEKDSETKKSSVPRNLSNYTIRVGNVCKLPRMRKQASRSRDISYGKVFVTCPALRADNAFTSLKSVRSAKNYNSPASNAAVRPSTKKRRV